ncbi:MAG: hypothetical protein K0S77_1215 [Pseudomonas sp.]|jgi:hypothetical protein|nr:hypothetical protein [Pseudomonas sp.]
MQNARSFVAFKLAFGETAGHLDTHAEHGLGHFHVLPLQKRLGILGEIQGYQGTFVLGAAQLDPAIRQLDNFKKGR